MRKRLTPEERRERRRRVVHRSKFALPSALTLLSILCGFSSVVMSINAAGENPGFYFRMAAILLLAAGFFDGVDGRVARATNTATEFGVQLDSLADVLSFGMAPAILAYRYGFFELGLADPRLRAVGWAACFFFVACGALRLARFNVQVGFVDSRFFVGLPIPAGAGCVASVILCWPGSPQTTPHAYVYALELFLVGALMVSTIRFPSFKKVSGSSWVRRWITLVILAILGVLALLIIFTSQFFLGLFSIYILLGLTLNAAWRLGWRGMLPPLKHAPKSEEAEDEEVTGH
jgi:CDP-diacylglycerol---serine O-phosphatidyltransferase